jgi:SET domain-containing protein
MTRMHPPEVYVADTGTMGLGVFAARAFRAGELVEEAPVLVLQSGQDALPMLLRQRTFSWGKLTGTRDGSEALVWGHGSLYNHASPSNLKFAARPETGTMVFSAARDIAADEELTINYEGDGGSSTSTDDRWARRHGIELV